MKLKFLHWLAIILILEIGTLHIMTAQGEYEEAAYVGYLFAANFFGALLAALGIYHRQLWGWVIGALIAAGSIAGYLWSRTLGMPGMNVEEWFDPYGVVAIALEVLFLLLFVLRPWKNFSGSLRLSNAISYSIPLLGLLVIASVSYSTYRWDTYIAQAYGHHVGSLDQVCSTPSTSLAELREEYGVEVSLVATSMMSSIVDVRIKIVDPVKAHALLQNQAALLVNQQALILAPHMHSHNTTRLKQGKVFTMFFPTQKIVTQGTEVSLVFGSVRVEPVIVR
jgi:hypothetical protein